MKDDDLLPPGGSQVLAWVATQKEDITEDGGIRSFALFHSVEDGLDRLLLLQNSPEKTSEVIAGVLWSTAENDSDTRSSGLPQRYVIHSYRDDPEEPDDTLAFVRTSQNALSKRGLGTETATDKGLLGQLMRMNEDLHRLHVGYSESIAGRLARDVDRLQRENAENEKKRFAMFEQMEALLDRKFERDMRREEYQKTNERDEKVMGVLMSLLPAVLSKVVKDKDAAGLLMGLTPGAGSAREEAMKAFVKNLDDTDLRGIMGAIGPEKSTALLELLEDLREKEGSTH